MSHYLVDQIKATREHHRGRRFGDRAPCTATGTWRRSTSATRRRAKRRRLEGHALFIFIGVAPRTEAFCSLVATDEQGFILTGAEARAAGKGWELDRDPLMFETSVPGIFAAGDVRANANRRIAAAVGEGSAAIFSIHQYLRSV